MGPGLYVRHLALRSFRTLNVIDESNREVLAIEIDLSLPAARVVRTLEQLEEIRGLPKAIRLDNGNELRSAVFIGWCESKGIDLKFIQPGKPQQNAFIERFNRTYRHEVLSAHIFENLNQVKDITEQWIKIYNEDRPHAALGKLSPIHYRQQAEFSSLGMSTQMGALQGTYQLKILWAPAGQVCRARLKLPCTFICQYFANRLV